MRIRRPRTAITLAMVAALLLGETIDVSAHASMIEIGSESESEPDSGEDGPCGPLDPDCRRRLLSLLAGNVNFLQPRVDTGVRFGHESPESIAAALRFSISLVNIDSMIGDLEALAFEASYLPDAGGLRLRFTMADSEALFLCTDFESGELKAPLVGWIQYDCRPDAELGVGGKVGEIQWDTGTGRLAARWLELQMVANLLANGNSFEYLSRRVSAFAGGSFETVWPGATEGSSEVIGRMKVGIMGMIRSNDSRLEVRGYAAYRPSLTGFADLAFEARSEILYHLLLSETLVGTVGADADYSYWTRPSRAIGPYASDREAHGAYLGLLFRMTFGDLGIPLTRGM